MSLNHAATVEFDQLKTMPHLSPWCFSWAKRFMDLFLSVFLLLCTAPLMTIAAVLVKTGSPGPAIFRQRRVGQNGTLFTIYKFRTMYLGEAGGSGLTFNKDPRITPIGGFLRNWKLDELPQLFNVLAGQMSIVGPRPDLPEFIACLPEALRPVLSLKPGLTSQASLRYRNESFRLKTDMNSQINQTYVDRLLPDKVRIDLQYAKHASLTGDLGIIFGTAIAILR
jgi:lipopolysaccharide/colanic/teichoic acid biosynthesis glycosyltransferase